MKRIFAAVAMAAAALATLGLAGPSVVSAGTSSQAATTQISGNRFLKGVVGYMMTGGRWRFRYLATTLTVPATTTRATDVRLELGNTVDGVSLSLSAGGGPGSIGYSVSWENGGTLALAPNVGDQVTISIYKNAATGETNFTAVDHTLGTSATAAMGWAPAYTEAVVRGGGPSWRLASSPTRLWAFKNTRLTTDRGYRGAILGPWNTYRFIGTRGGTPTGKVVLWPSYPWNGGHNFGIWWRAS